MLALWTLILPIVWATEFTFYTVEFQPGNSAGFTSLSGEMVVPPYPGASQTFLWPGLQDQTGWGVLQPVLEAEPVLASRQTGQSGSWTFTPGWYNKSATPQMTMGTAFTPSGSGDSVKFSLTNQGADWDVECSETGGGGTASGNFPLGDLDFYLAVFAVELQNGQVWNFGPLTFNNIAMTAQGTDSSWCSEGAASNVNNATDYTISGVSASVGQDSVTCNVQQIVLLGPSEASGFHSQEGQGAQSQSPNTNTSPPNTGTVQPSTNEDQPVSNLNGTLTTNPQSNPVTNPQPNPVVQPQLLPATNPQSNSEMKSGQDDTSGDTGNAAQDLLDQVMGQVGM